MHSLQISEAGLGRFVDRHDSSQAKGVIMPVVSSGESQATASTCVPRWTRPGWSGGLLWTFAVCMESEKHEI